MKVFLVKQESNCDGEMLFNVTPCKDMETAKKVMEDEVKTMLTESVDYNGIVTLNSNGSAVITATSSDSSQVKAECKVIVSEKGGIDEILIDKEAYVKIYSLNGVLIYQGVYSQSNLASGTYIILIDGKALKSIIR